MRHFIKDDGKSKAAAAGGDELIERIYAKFVAYKMNVPVCGAIILNDKLDKVLLVRGWNQKSSWTFPKGKINQNEADAVCAVREVWEEVGWDIADRIDPQLYFE